MQVITKKDAKSLFDVQDEDSEKKEIAEALNSLKSNPSQITAMKTVHATAMQKARELVASRNK